jgi:hypothetical protein
MNLKAFLGSILSSLTPFLLGCDQTPTASEVFHLRGKCEELGKQFLEKVVEGEDGIKSQVSHYNPRMNRCYVLVTWHAPQYGGIHSKWLYDGQKQDPRDSIVMTHREE